jgi:hypothetical protein
MKKLTLGIATAAVLFTAAPAMAQIGFDVGPGGFGVEVGPPYGYHHPRYYDYYGQPGWEGGHRYWHGRHFNHGPWR